MARNRSGCPSFFFVLFKEKGSLALKTINLNQITVSRQIFALGDYFKVDLGQGAHLIEKSTQSKKYRKDSDEKNIQHESSKPLKNTFAGVYSLTSE